MPDAAPFGLDKTLTLKRKVKIMYKAMKQNHRKLNKVLGNDWCKISHITITNEPFMKLHFESLGGNRFSIAHYYEQNGDLVPDPDMEILLHPEEKIVEVLSFQDYYGYRRVYHSLDRRMVDMKAKVSLNKFLSFWLTNLINQGFKYQAQLSLGCS